jgi:DUF4097 and DUF4098 domain-containing protein YvlB
MTMETFQTPGPLALRLRVPAGDIELETVDGHETTVEVQALRTDEATLAAVEETRIDLRDRASAGHELRVEVPERGSTSRLGFLFSRSPEVRVRITCPHGADLEVRSRAADLDGRGRFANLEVETTSGDVDVREVDGSVRVRAVSGDLRLGRVGLGAELQTVSGDVMVESCDGPATLQSVSGDVQLRNAGGAVTLNSVSGDQGADNVGNGPVSSQSVSGDIRIGVRPGVRVWIDAASRSGDVTSELDVGEGRAREGPVAELRIQTLSGDIAIVRSAKAPTTSVERSNPELPD